MTCQHFTYGVDQHCHTMLGCNLRQKQLQQGQHLKKKCKLLLRGRRRWVRSVVSLFLLTSHDKGLRATQSGVSLKLFSMLRFGTLLVIAATALSGCSIDMEKLMDCKDADGNPLPESVCKKGSPEKSD